MSIGRFDYRPVLNDLTVRTPITTVERIVPSTSLPYIIFLPKAPYFFMTSSLGSDNRTKGNAYFVANVLCEAILSLLTPKTTAPAFFRAEP